MARLPRHSARLTRTQRRRLAVTVCLAVAVVVIAGGLIVNWLTGSRVVWSWLIVAAGFAVGIVAWYLWIRLSDDTTP